MKRSWIGWIVAAPLAALPLCQAAAQGLIAPTHQYGQPQPYQTPMYRPPTPSSLDKNYGVPSFGQKGAELPQQKTTAPEKKADDAGAEKQADVPGSQATPDDAGVPDFFKGSTEIELPPTRTSSAAGANMETPLSTTSDGSTLDDNDTPADDTVSRTATTDGTTGDTTDSKGTAAR
jgi:hypothetical protein